MIYGFYLNRFRYGSLSAASRCSAVVDDEHKTLTISNKDEVNAFPAQKLLLDAISSISFGRGPYSAMLEFDTAPKLASGRAPQLFIELQRPSDRSSFHGVLKKEIGDNLRTEGSHNGPFVRWEDNISELSVQELYATLAVKETEIKSLREQLASACVDPPNDTRAEPQRRYRLDDLYPFRISQVSKVVNAYSRNKEKLKSVQDDLAGAEDQIAWQQARITALVVALMNPDAIPAIMSEKDFHKYLASSPFSLLPDDIVALNDNSDYKQAVARVFREQKSLKLTR